MEKEEKIAEIVKLLNLQSFVINEAIENEPIECFAKTIEDAKRIFLDDVNKNSHHNDCPIKDSFPEKQRLALLKWIELCDVDEQLLEIYKIVVYCEELRDVVIRKIYSLY